LVWRWRIRPEHWTGEEEFRSSPSAFRIQSISSIADRLELSRDIPRAAYSWPTATSWFRTLTSDAAVCRIPDAKHKKWRPLPSQQLWRLGPSASPKQRTLCLHGSLSAISNVQ